MDFTNNLTLLSKCKNIKIGYEDDLLVKDNRYLNNYGLREEYNLKTIIDIISKSYLKAIFNYELNIWFNNNIYYNNNKNNIYLSYYKTIELENLIYISLKALLNLCTSNIYNGHDSLQLLNLYNKYYKLYIHLYNLKNNFSDSDNSETYSEIILSGNTSSEETSSEETSSDNISPVAIIRQNHIEFSSTSPTSQNNIIGYNYNKYGPVFINPNQVPIHNISLNIIEDKNEDIIYCKNSEQINDNTPKKTLCEKICSIFRTIKNAVHSAYKNVITFFSTIMKKETK
jgi:hypothetical protein